MYLFFKINDLILNVITNRRITAVTITHDIKSAIKTGDYYYFIDNGIIQDKGVYWPIIGISLIIFLAALGNTFGQDFLEQGQDQPADDFTQNITEIFFNPKVIAIISIFTLSIFMVILLTV